MGTNVPTAALAGQMPIGNGGDELEPATVDDDTKERIEETRATVEKIKARLPRRERAFLSRLVMKGETLARDWRIGGHLSRAG